MISIEMFSLSFLLATSITSRHIQKHKFMKENKIILSISQFVNEEI